MVKNSESNYDMRVRWLKKRAMQDSIIDGRYLTLREAVF
jgi:hypothetical protein